MSGKRWAFEDFEVGGEIAFGPHRMVAEDMVAFATDFDPQAMHLDEAAGRETMLGGLSASGLYTASTFMRMMCDAYILDSTSQGSPGVDYVNFRKPVLAGDELEGRTVVLSKRVSKSKPGLGFVSVRHELKNQRGEIVCEMANTGMFLLRNPEAVS